MNRSYRCRKCGHVRPEDDARFHECEPTAAYIEADRKAAEWLKGIRKTHTKVEFAMTVQSVEAKYLSIVTAGYSDEEADLHQEQVWKFCKAVTPIEAMLVWTIMSDEQKRAAEVQLGTEDAPTPPTIDDQLREAVSWHFSMNPPARLCADFLCVYCNAIPVHANGASCDSCAVIERDAESKYLNSINR